MNSLPTEVLSLIVKNIDAQDLYACTRLNKQFYKLTYALSWQQLEITTLRQGLKLLVSFRDAPHRLFQNMHHVRKLILRLEVDDDIFMLCTSFVPLLEELTHPLDLRSIHAYHRPKLPPISSQMPSSQGTPFEERPSYTTLFCDVGPALSSTPNTHLSICPTLTPHLFEALANCQLLEVIKVNCDLAQDLAVFHRLRVLDLYAIPIQFGPFVVTATTTTNAAAWPQLTEFRLHPCRYIDEQDAIAFMQTHPHLIKLGLQYCPFSETFLDAVPIYLPAITELDIANGFHTTCHEISMLVWNCPHLRLQPEGSPEARHFFHNEGCEILDSLDSADIRALRRALAHEEGFNNNNSSSSSSSSSSSNDTIVSNK
ncbi:unnamed protein product [Absidia cylindrospora]